jgi:hypothetical protein
MQKFSKIFFLGLALLFVFTLTGCGQKSSSGGVSSGSADEATGKNSLLDRSAGTNKEAKDIFKETVEVELPDSPALEIEREIRPILKKTFGDLKVTGYSSDVYGAGSLLVEYTPSQKPAPSELPKITEALKDKGYVVAMEHVDNNIGTAMYEGSKYTLTVTINIATPIVGVSYIKK